MLKKYARLIVMLSAFAVASAAITASAQVRSGDSRRQAPDEETTRNDDSDDRRRGDSRRQQEIRQQEQEDQEMMQQSVVGRNAVGPMFGFITEFDNSGFIGVDGRFSVDLSPGQVLMINPALNYYLISQDGFSLFQIDANVLYPFMLDGAFTPYAGGGLGIFYARFPSIDLSTGDETTSSDTDVGLNLVGGSEYNFGGSISAFAQARLSFWDGSAFSLMGGVLFAF